MSTVRTIPPAPVKTVRIQLTSGVIMAPGTHGVAGEEWDVPRHQATELINNGLAVLAPGEPEPPHPSPEYGIRIERPTVADPVPAKARPRGRKDVQTPANDEAKINFTESGE